MTQDELWLQKWRELMDFLETNHRRPSEFIPEQRNMLSRWKHMNKLLNAGEMKEDRVAMFEKSLLLEMFQHINQYRLILWYKNLFTYNHLTTGHAIVHDADLMLNLPQVEQNEHGSGSRMSEVITLATAVA